MIKWQNDVNLNWKYHFWMYCFAVNANAVKESNMEVWEPAFWMNIENCTFKVGHFSDLTVPLSFLQCPLWEGRGHVVSGVHSWGAQWRPAPVPRREWDRPALHHPEGSGPTASGADEALLQQLPLPRHAGEPVCSLPLRHASSLPPSTSFILSFPQRLSLSSPCPHGSAPSMVTHWMCAELFAAAHFWHLIDQPYSTLSLLIFSLLSLFVFLFLSISLSTLSFSVPSWLSLSLSVTTAQRHTPTLPRSRRLQDNSWEQRPILTRGLLAMKTLTNTTITPD